MYCLSPLGIWRQERGEIQIFSHVTRKINKGKPSYGNKCLLTNVYWQMEYILHFGEISSYLLRPRNWWGNPTPTVDFLNFLNQTFILQCPPSLSLNSRGSEKSRQIHKDTQKAVKRVESISSKDKQKENEMRRVKGRWLSLCITISAYGLFPIIDFNKTLKHITLLESFIQMTAHLKVQNIYKKFAKFQYHLWYYL